ncbi:hypothetical protein [Mycolicibacterium sp. YH-1]|uniref:hypothetical protein n=1 Tax=Mycolicibacterium sp. YH-1 TaxID=2908837 RepID=UPI001F4C1D5D|nr:hypothetical protein [Mycolicibacterium sp. YH-1]UNB55018.1 hypothetical protein L0M16_12290 [Mycolicibacterium sp. YH-1]
MRIQSRCGRWALLTAVALLTACGASDSGSGESSVAAPVSVPASVSSTAAAGPPPSAPQTKQWVDLQVGECVAEVPAVDVGEATVTAVDCSGPHRAEVYLLAPVAVNAAIADVADRACAAGVDQYTGGAAERTLSVTYLIDSKQDRTGAIPLPSTVICLLQAVDGGPLEGSARG